MSEVRYVRTGWSITSILAAILSWMLNHSVGYAVLHLILGWIYLLYAAIWRTQEVANVIHRTFG